MMSHSKPAENAYPDRKDAPPRLRIGVTGHRFLAGTAEGNAFGKLAAALDQVSDALSHAFPIAVPAAPPQTWQVISPLAEGADQLVAQHFLDRGASLLVPLPLPIPVYLEDFRSPESRAAFSALLERAAEVVQLPPTATREEAYLQVGLYVLAHSHVLVALWDGRPEQGSGGTGEIVQLARQVGLPLAWVHTQRSPLPTPQMGEHLQIDHGMVTFERFPAPTAIIRSSDFSRSPKTKDDDDE